MDIGEVFGKEFRKDFDKDVRKNVNGRDVGEVASVFGKDFGKVYPEEVDEMPSARAGSATVQAAAISPRPCWVEGSSPRPPVQGSSPRTPAQGSSPRPQVRGSSPRPLMLRSMRARPLVASSSTAGERLPYQRPGERTCIARRLRPAKART